MTAAAAPRRLSALDGSFLRLETGQAHMHVGWSAILAAPAPGRPRPTVEALRARAARRLQAVPWARWRLEAAPLGLTEPRWVDDERFDLAAHIVALTGPDDAVDAASFEALRAAVLSAPMDRARPLWQVCLVPRLEHGRAGLVGKIHHALVDGVAALQIAGLLIDEQADGAPVAPAGARADRGRPAARGEPPGLAGWAMQGARTALRDGAGAVRAGARALADPLGGARAAARTARRLATAVGEDVLPPAPRSPFNERIGARRTLVGYRAPRELLRAARSTGGGTLNDVGLAAVAGALRAFERRGGPAPRAPLKAMVPVSMRRHGDAAAGNRIALVYVPLPVHLPTCAERLASVREQTARLRHGDRAEATRTLVRTLGAVPPPLRTPVARALATPRQFNLTVSQSPAPRGSLHVLGCELDEVYSVVPIAQGHALAVGMVRYRQELFFGCHADPDALPGVGELPGLIDRELHALAAAAERRRERRGAASRPPVR